MKSKVNKTMSVIMSCTMLMTLFFPHNIMKVHAICCRKDGFDKSRYTLTGNMAEDAATIAKSQKGRFCDDFGYTGVDWGAWCDEYVADCLENAGCDSSIVAHGGTVADFAREMRNRGAVEVSSPQTGDLVFFTYSHVEIVTRVENGVVYSAGGNNRDPNTNTYHDGGCCAGEHRTSSISYYLRPNYRTQYDNAPTYSLLSSSSTSIAVNEEITFYASSDCAQGYTIGVDNSDGRYITQEMPGGQLTLKFTEPGNYGAYVTSYNPKGYCDSSWISFNVYDSKPNTSRLSADKTAISIGGSITFSASSDDPVKGFTIGIDNSEGRYITQEMPDGILTLTFDKPGKYGAYVTSYNNYGYSDSEWITFDVYDTKPSCSFLSADKKIAYVGQDITFNASSDIATGYTIGVDNESERLVTQEMPDGSLTLSFDTPGEYSAYVTSYNSIGYADSKRVFFTVYNTPPTYSTLSSNFNKIVVNESITFSAESDLANEFTIGIELNEERIITERMPEGQLTKTFTEPGTYWAYVTSSNGYGYVDSKWISFNVYATEDDMVYNGDCNCDGEFNVSDVVLLQKWLLAVPDTHIEDWKAADLCKDNKLDVFDLCLMKRKLIYSEF